MSEKKAIVIHLSPELKKKAQIRAVKKETNLKNYIETMIINDVSGEQLGDVAQVTVVKPTETVKKQVIKPSAASGGDGAY